MPLISIPPVEIIIDIPDLIVNGISLKRKAELFTMIYNQATKSLTLSWIVSYPDLQGIKGLSSYSKESIADNTTIVDITTGAILTPDGDGNYLGDYIGQYDWFNMIAETQSLNVHEMIRQYGHQADWSQ